jgi:hypothetical protein
MFGRAHAPRPSEDDPAVPVVEQILSAAAARNPAKQQQVEGRRVATRALWICACETINDAPTWLIHDDADGIGIAWCRVPDGADVGDVVDARLIAGGHTDPGDVLLWLQGKASERWIYDDAFDDDGVIEELGGRIRHP